MTQGQKKRKAIRMPIMQLKHVGNVIFSTTNLKTAQSLSAQAECGETKIQANLFWYDFYGSILCQGEGLCWIVSNIRAQM